MAETLAIQIALIRTIKDRYPKDIFESDSLNIVKAINGELDPPKDISNLVQDIIILAKNVHDIYFVFCKRTVNVLADRIVKETLRSYKSSNCINEMISFLFSKNQVSKNDLRNIPFSKIY